MPTTITLRLDDKTYKKFRILAERDNRTLSNFIETAALRYIVESGLADEAEMAECVKAYDTAKSSGGAAIPFHKAVAELRRKKTR